MQSIVFKYLEFLLPIHNCVIIPDLGGFIVNLDPSAHSDDGRIIAPAYRVVFNPELKHNDGLLASLICKDGNVSYNAACSKIKNEVADIRRMLQNEAVVRCNNLGYFHLSQDGIIVFKSSSLLSHPSLFGLSDVNLKPLLEINQCEFIKERKARPLRFTFGTVAAASVALFLMITPSLTIQDSGNNSQQADFIYGLAKELPVVSEKAPNTAIESLITANQISESAVSSAVKPLRTYYIIVGGEETQARANILLDKIRAEHFPKADLIESDRYRIYVASFTDKDEAEDYLAKFRNDNPAYKTAWLFSKRNN